MSRWTFREPFWTITCSSGNIGSSILAAIYFADAVLYWFSWQGAWPHPDGVALSGDYMNMAASLGFVATSVLYFYEVGPEGASVFSIVLAIETGLAFIFVVDALAYGVGVVLDGPPVPHRGCSLRDIDLWSNLFNVVAALLALLSSVLGVWLHWTQTRAAQERGVRRRQAAAAGARQPRTTRRQRGSGSCGRSRWELAAARCCCCCCCGAAGGGAPCC